MKHLVSSEEYSEAKHMAASLPSITLNNRQLCDIELLLNGGFAPLKGFFNNKDYDSVCKSMRLADGTLWPIPITLDITEEKTKSFSAGDQLALRDQDGFLLALLLIEDIWIPDRIKEAQQVFGTSDDFHPGVSYLLYQSESVYVGGALKGLALPKHYDYSTLRHTVPELKAEISYLNWKNIVAFQTRNPMHRAHVEITQRAMANTGANLLIQPVVGMTKPGDIDHHTRVRCYQHILNEYRSDTVKLSLLPLAMRMGGPREALWHAIIRKNYGCTHFIIGRDHAGPGNDSKGNPFYGPYDSQQLMRKYETELGIKMVEFDNMVYVKDSAQYCFESEIKKGTKKFNLSGSDLRFHLDKGDKIPDWFSYPEVVKELRQSRPELKKRGFTVFFTGLPSSGKSTLANGLLVRLMEYGSRPVTLLDGDVIRTHLSSELGFSKEHRSINVRRIGFVASEITKHNGIAICAPIAPYYSDRKVNRNLISNFGGYIEIYVNTPLEVCEKRDAKGLYAKARKGMIKKFTGISNPYEAPENPELIIDSSQKNPEQLVQAIIVKLEELCYL